MSRKPTSMLATVALILSIFCWPVGLILGIVASIQLGKPDAEAGGRGFATAAIIVSAAQLVLTMILAAIAVPNFVRYQQRAKSVEAHNHLNRIKAGLERFYHKNRGYPKAVATPDGIPGEEPVAWTARPCDPACSDKKLKACSSFECIDFSPEGGVRFTYACEVNDTHQAYACAALGDVDGDSVPSMYVIASGTGKPVAPIPDFGGRAPPCPNAVGGKITECTPEEF